MRVIVVGSGISGLITGHALLKAGIDDFVILERRADNPVEQKGSVIGLFQQTMRILDQLDLLHDVEKLTPPLRHWLHLDAEGRTIYDGDLYERLEQNHGHHALLFLRRELMEVFYDRLPNRERRVLTNKKVVSIEQDESSVTVSCADGSSFRGDVVIGCDGVHSVVRRLALDPLTSSKTTTGNSSKQTTTLSRAEYRGLFGWSPRPEGLPGRYVTETHGKDLVVMVLSDDDRSYWLVTDRKDKTDVPDRLKYNDGDIQQLVDRIKDHSVAPGRKVTFGELWKTRGGAGAAMYDYHENVCDKWHDRRVVIVGDAAHKMTPNLGQGGNHSIETVASLMNHLHPLVQNNPNPTAQELDAAFGAMQREREAKVRKIVGLTGMYTRWSTFHTWIGRFIITRVWPFLGDKFVADRLLAPLVSESVKLDFVEEKNLRPGKKAWKYT